MFESLLTTPSDWSLTVIRVVLGLIFFAHGAQKMLGWYGGPGLAQSMQMFTEHLHLPSTLAFLVIAGEFLGGIGLVVGLLSRPAALFIALTMLGAIAMVHLRHGLFLNWFGNKEGHGIEYHLLAIALSLVVIVKGAGAFSVDRLVDENVLAPHHTPYSATQKERIRTHPKILSNHGGQLAQ
jgi:putative oxidoreductase